MSAIEDQQRLVLWGYVLQWVTLPMPPTIVASLVYVLVMRHRVAHEGLRSHMNWQLSTCIVIAIAIPVGLLLLFIGFSGFSTDSLVSVIATFLLVGLAALLVPWFIYRALFGTIKLYNEQPITRMFP